MYDSILITIKKMLGLQAGYTPFDSEILVFINTAMMVLQQLGVGPNSGFTVYSEEEVWSDFVQSDVMLEGVKTYIYLSVKIVFDPPGSSVVMDAMKSLKDELEWRLREQAEFYPGDGTTKGYWQQVVEDEKSAAESADGE
jgi:hypothetical protein